MLKIKDNVDLKELEKFGFEKREFYYIFCDGSDSGYYYYDTIRIELVCKELEICSVNNKIIDDLLFDLFQAGLVEKV